MPQKRKSGYSNNDDFVVSDGEENSSTSRQNKRSKIVGETASSHFSKASSLSQRDSNGDIYWEISKARRVTLSDFKGKKMVAIREYYEKDGDWFPGKKGISMTLEQYNALLGVLPNIEKELKRSGVQDISRPNYGLVDDADGPVSGDAEIESDDVEEGGQAGGRANHEATSDEED